MSRKATYGSYGAMDKARADADFYRSPPDAMGMLLGAVAPDRLCDGLIVDAGAGDGRLTKPLMLAGYRVKGYELHDRDFDPFLDIETGVDFLSLSSLGDAEGVVMNPPYDLADEFVRHALKLLPVGRAVHALLRHVWMAGLKRADLIPSLSRIVMCRRLKMMPADREHDDKGYGATTDFSWFTFVKGRTDSRAEIVHAKPKEKING